MIRPLLVAGIALVLAALAVGWVAAQREAARPTAASEDGTPIPPFVLQRCDGSGAPFTEADLHGRVHLVYFGFTTCPDVCPTELAWLTRVLRALGPAAERVRVLFITVDPERDDAQRLAEYAALFDHRILPLRGDAAQTRAAADAFGAIYRVNRPVSQQPGFYLVDHTLSTFVVDARGRLVHRFDSRDLPPAEAAALVRRWLGAP